MGGSDFFHHLEGKGAIPGILAVYTANWVILYYLAPVYKNQSNPLKKIQAFPLSR